MKSTNIKDKMPSKNIIKASVINLLDTIVYSVAFLLGNYYDQDIRDYYKFDMQNIHVFYVFSIQTFFTIILQIYIIYISCKFAGY